MLSVLSVLSVDGIRRGDVGGHGGVHYGHAFCFCYVFFGDPNQIVSISSDLGFWRKTLLLHPLAV